VQRTSFWRSVSRIEGRGSMLAPASKVSAIQGRCGSPRAISTEVTVGLGTEVGITSATGVEVGRGVIVATGVSLGGIVADGIGEGVVGGATVGVALEASAGAEVGVAVGNGVDVGVAVANWEITGKFSQGVPRQPADSTSRVSRSRPRVLLCFKG
jgi:hypothetical protein